MLMKKERERYWRQIIIPGFGTEGQKRLKKGRVAIVGAGGLGSAVGMYITAAASRKISHFGSSSRDNRSNPGDRSYKVFCGNEAIAGK